MSKKLIACAAAALTVLSGCQSTTATGNTTTTTTTGGSGSSTPPTYAQAVSTRANGPVTFAYDTSTNPTKVTLDADSFTRTTIAGLSGNFSTHQKTGTSEFALHALSDNGLGEVFITRGASQISRSVDVTLPVETYVTYSGRYAGLWGDMDDAEAKAHVFGDVALQWFVDTDTLTGTISNRITNNNTAVADVTLQATLNDQGVFTGSTAGGGLGGANGSPGLMSAIPLGPASGQMVGELSFLSSIGTTFYSEFGGFVTTSD